VREPLSALLSRTRAGWATVNAHGISDETSKAKEIIQRTGPERLIGLKI
jgi:hypothetical protein